MTKKSTTGGWKQVTYLIHPWDARLAEWETRYMSAPSRSEAVRLAVDYSLEVMTKLQEMMKEIDEPDLRGAYGQKGGVGNLTIHEKREDEEKLRELADLLGSSKSEALRTALRVYAAFLAQQTK